MIEKFFNKKPANDEGEATVLDKMRSVALQSLSAYALEKKMLPVTVERVSTIIAGVAEPETLKDDAMQNMSRIAEAILENVADDGSNEAMLARGFAAQLINHVN